MAGVSFDKNINSVQKNELRRAHQKGLFSASPSARGNPTLKGNLISSQIWDVRIIDCLRPKWHQRRGRKSAFCLQFSAGGRKCFLSGANEQRRKKVFAWFKGSGLFSRHLSSPARANGERLLTFGSCSLLNDLASTKLHHSIPINTHWGRDIISINEKHFKSKKNNYTSFKFKLLLSNRVPHSFNIFNFALHALK